MRARRLLATFWDHTQGATATGWSGTDRRTAACLPASDSTPVWFFYYHLDVRKLLGASSKEHFIKHLHAALRFYFSSCADTSGNTVPLGSITGIWDFI